MDPLASFQHFWASCQRREPQAIQALVERYLPLVRAAVRRRLSPRLRTQFDSHDFTQNVWASFFEEVELDRLDMPTEESLVAYLIRLAELKVTEETRCRFSQAADVRRGVPLGEMPEPVGSGATASHQVIAAERWDELTTGLSDRDRDMLRMLVEGHTYRAVADRFGLTAKTVQRLVDRLRGGRTVEGNA